MSNSKFRSKYLQADVTFRMIEHRPKDSIKSIVQALEQVYISRCVQENGLQKAKKILVGKEVRVGGDGHSFSEYTRIEILAVA
jgi:hypothetical protein